MARDEAARASSDERASAAASGAESATRLGRADLHMHTNLGDGTASPARVLREARRHGLDLIAVTDHDHMEGAKRVAELLAREAEADAPSEQPPIQLITGCEVTTRDGHFLGLFMREPVPMLRRVEDTIDAIKAQGGLCIVPHPMGRLVPSLSRRKIEDLLNRGFALDGIELYNPSPANARARAEVRQLNGDWGLAPTGSSDAHFWQHIGAGYTLFRGRSPDDLRQAILGRATRDGGQECPPAHLPAAAYVLQCSWAWFVDPPRKIARMVRQRQARG